MIHIMISQLSKIDHGHTRTIRETVCQAKYEGTAPNTKKTSDIPLLLLDNHKPIQPSTGSKYIDCHYSVTIECDVPWAPDLIISSPIIIYSGANEQWQHWQQPSWIGEASLGTNINPNLAVPQDILESRFGQNGIFQPPQGYAPPPAISNSNSSAQPNPDFRGPVSDRTPLLH